MFLNERISFVCCLLERLTNHSTEVLEDLEGDKRAGDKQLAEFLWNDESCISGELALYTTITFVSSLNSRTVVIE